MRRLLAFDSGIGGLSVVRELRALLPDTPIDYLADNAVFPYGELPDPVLIARVCVLVETALARLRPDAVVIACNTASTVALAELRRRFDVPFIGCVPPIKWASEVSVTRTIGLLATSATVRRPYLRDLQSQFAPDCTLLAHGARGLADIAEAAFRHRAIDRDSVAHEVAQLFEQPGGERIDVVGIGCTHYSFLLDTLRELSPPGITWLDPAGAVARRAKSVLEGLSEAAPEGRAAVAGKAWFTGQPADADRLLQGLATFGYGGFLEFGKMQVQQSREL
ncbi:glutamate racemase [Lichenicola sp.]|uniref:glutamate racemase n=1 Tax=Lichenicola sp. TaxID=2804529 RepID=UPI003B005272